MQQQPEWFFDVTRYPSRESYTSHRHIRATALIRAEEAQRDFVQTLTKHFAHLVYRSGNFQPRPAAGAFLTPHLPILPACPSPSSARVQPLHFILRRIA